MVRSSNEDDGSAFGLRLKISLSPGFDCLGSELGNSVDTAWISPTLPKEHKDNKPP